MLRFVSRFGGDPNEKELDRLQPLVDQVGELEPRFKELTDAQLRESTQGLLARQHAGASLDDLLPEAFAAVREASKRTTSMRHFDVQILGGIFLHQGKVVEMKTGEGKTLVATLALYLNGLTGRGAHLITVNDYLARRDVQWMGPIYHLLGLTVGLLQQGEGAAFLFDPEFARGDFKYLRPVDRQEAYAAHITYGTNHEYGFDYLRDNLAYSLDRRVQRELHYAIIDEVDNILIDEARTPLIISGQSDEPLEEYKRFAHIARKLRPEIDYELDEKERNVVLSEAGLAKVEAETGIENIYDEANFQYVHYMEQALRAQVLFHKDRDYIKQGQRIVLVDEFTGRLMADRRLSDGLHQAIESKEGVPIRPRMMTQATITLQNYFRMYEKLAGMTGTASTEAEELDKIYKLDVVVLPTNVEYMARGPEASLVQKRVKEDGTEIVVYCDRTNPDQVLFYRRADYQDAVYKSEQAKWQTITEEIEELHQDGRPVLVGTTSVEKSERLSGMLKARGIPHEVLNAKNHTREAAIIARAGEPKAVTIATNMAGRGVDIKLGGELSEETIATAHRLLQSRGIDPYRASPAQLYTGIAEVDPDYVRRREQVLELGGLHVLGTERHEARRIDNQLRGRAGRQGEPGSSRFYLSLEDDLMRRFGGPSVASLMDRLGVEEDIPIEHGMVSRTIEGAQTKVEGYNFDIRKHLLEYDDVLNRQRELIYGRRYRFLTSKDLEPELWEMLESELDRKLSEAFGKEGDEVALLNYLDEVMPLSIAPPDGPFPYQYSFLGKLTCFPPFSILFLASQLLPEAGKMTADRVVQLGEQASDEYRQHLLATLIDDPFNTAMRQYKESLSSMTESMENKIEDYTSLAEEQERSLSGQELLQYVQSVSPLTLNVKPSELGRMPIAEVEDLLLEQLERDYHQELCEKLLRAVQMRIPAAMKLEQIKTSEISARDVEVLLTNSLSDSSDSDRARLTTMAQGKGTLLDLLFQLNGLATTDLGALQRVLVQAVSLAYDRWATAQLEEMRRAVQEKASQLQTTSSEELTGILLEVVFAERADFDRGHLKRFSFAQRFPLPFLALPLLRDLRRDEVRELALELMEAALVARQETWGRQELSRLGQSPLQDLEGDLYDGLAAHYGEAVLQGVEQETLGELNPQLYERVRAYLGIKQLEGVSIADLDIFEKLVPHLQRRLETELAVSVSELDERLAAQIEDYLLAEGYFEEAGAVERLLHKPIAGLDRPVREGIASHAGHRELEQLGEIPVGSWDPDLRLTVVEYLRSRGHFVDEQRVQRFFVHGSLQDLEPEIAQEACAFIIKKRLEKVESRAIGALKGDFRETVLGHLQGEGLLVDVERQERFAHQPLAELDEETAQGLISYLGQRQLEAAGSVASLPDDARRHLDLRLRESRHFADQGAFEAFRQAKVSDLEKSLYQRLKDRLLAGVEQDLQGKLVGELPPYLQQTIRDYLHQTDYYLDQSKARQFESLTLSDLDASVVRDLEQLVGQQIVSELGQLKFMSLDQQIRESILHYLDLENLFTKKKKREQFTKLSLSEADPSVREGIAYHLGRERLAELREVRFSDLPDDLRQKVWQHLRDNGHFIDAAKEECLEIEEVQGFEPQLRQGVQAAIRARIEALLSEHTVDDLPEEMRARVFAELEQGDYFLDRARLERFQAAEATALEPDDFEVVRRHLGRRLFSEIRSQRASELTDGLRQDVETYLRGSDYFLDQAKKDKLLQRRLADLENEAQRGLIGFLARGLASEIVPRPVAELEKGDREYLREYLDSVGYFLDQEALDRFQSALLSDLALDTREYEGLASWLGQTWLEVHAGRRFGELEQELRDDIQRYLRSTDYFVDADKLQRFRDKGLKDLERDKRGELLRYLSQSMAEEIGGKRFEDLDEATRREVEQLLAEERYGLDDAAMKEFKGRSLSDLGEELRQGLARYLGHQRLSEIVGKAGSQLDEQDKSEVQRYLGKQLMQEIEKRLMLGFTSTLWVDYLTAIEDLRQGIGLQAYGQMDPLVEYKRRAFRMFGELNDNINRMVVGNIFRYPPQPLRVAPAGQRE